MRTHQQFITELKKLINFYRSSLYAYDQTDYFLYQWRKKKDSLIEIDIEANPPSFYKSKSKGVVSENQKNLAEIVFVRFVSALEVFLIDQIREIFISHKEPFKKDNIILEFRQSDLLSIKSTADIYNLVISKELRRLSSGGFNEIIKYYNKSLKIDVAKIYPGFKVMEEYHQRRHLLVHRLGKTDQFYRDKYNYQEHNITVENFYLESCFEDFKKFSEELLEQVENRSKENFSIQKANKKPEAKCQIEVEFSKKTTPIFEPNYEFWAGDSLCMFNNLFDRKVFHSPQIPTFYLSGSASEILAYNAIVEAEVKRCKIKATIVSKISKPNSQKSITLDKYLIEKIRLKLPEQPWQKNQHKRTAKELGLSNAIVSKAITELIKNGSFKSQSGGKLLEG
jgi:hypothetical protein